MSPTTAPRRTLASKRPVLGRWMGVAGLGLLPLYATATVDWAAAQSAAPSAPDSPASADRSSSLALGQADALSSSATFTALAQYLSQLPVDVPVLVAVGPLKHDTQLSAAAAQAIEKALQKVVAPRAPQVRSVVETTEQLDEAKAIALRDKLALLYLAPSLRGGGLEIRSTLFKWSTGFWTRTLSPAGTSVHDSTHTSDIEGPLRQLFGVQELQLHPKLRVKAPESDTLAALCSDIDHDGVVEVWLVGRHSIVLGSHDGQSFRSLRTASWQELSAVRGTPLKSPVAAIVPSLTGVLVGTSDREEMIQLNAELQVVARSPAAYPTGKDSCASFTSTGVSDASFSCAASPRQGRHSLDAWAHGEFRENNGTTTLISFQIPQGSDSAQLEVEAFAQAAQSLTLKDTGTAAAWADLNGDGRLEFITTSAAPVSEKDAIVISSFDGSSLIERSRFPSDSIRAVAVCPFTGKNPLTVVAAVGDELWFMH